MGNGKILEFREEIYGMKHDMIAYMHKYGVFEDDATLSVDTDMAPFLGRMWHMCDLFCDIMLAQERERNEMNDKLDRILANIEKD